MSDGLEEDEKRGFQGVVPNIQDTRMLPIFAVLKVYRIGISLERTGGVAGPFYQYGLYARMVKEW